MPMKIISRLFPALLIAAFAVGVLKIQFLGPAFVQSAETCGEEAFNACMEGKTSEVTACGRKCPQKEKPCQPGDPPGATCYGYDESCLNACSSAAEQECRTKTVCPPDATKPPPPPSAQPPSQPPSSGEQEYDEWWYIANMLEPFTPGPPFPNGNFVIRYDDLYPELDEKLVQTLVGKKDSSTFIIVRVHRENSATFTEFLTTEDGYPVGWRTWQTWQEEKSPSKFGVYGARILTQSGGEEVRALLGAKPKEAGQFKEEWERLHALRPPPKGNDWPVYVLAVDGGGSIEVRDSSRDRTFEEMDGFGHRYWKTLQGSPWTDVSGGDLVPELGEIMTDFDTEVTLVTPDGSILTLGELSSLEIDLKSKQLDEKLFDIRFGELKYQHMRWDAGSTDTQVKAGNTSASIRGTHFGVAYNPDIDVAVYEIYDGTIEVTSEKTGKTVALSSSYDKPIKRVEIGSDGEFVYKTAIPGDEWQERQELATRGAEQKKTPLALWVFDVVGFILAIGVGYIIYRLKIRQS